MYDRGEKEVTWTYGMTAGVFWVRRENLVKSLEAVGIEVVDKTDAAWRGW